MNYTKKAYKYLRKCGILGHSRKMNIYGVHPLAISCTYLILTAILAKAARNIVNSIFNNGIVKSMVLELIATAELCASCFELIIVADNYGVAVYSLFLFILTIWWSINWEDTTACPYNVIEEVLEGCRSIKQAMLLIFSQLLGGLVIFRYVQILWSLELAETHKGRAFEDCTADLNVSMIAGALVEGIATCMCRIMSRALSETNLRYAHILDAFFATTMVVVAFNFSGGYFNPALATSLKYGCDGNTFVEHMVVYWIGATTGSVVSVYLFRSSYIQSKLEKIKPKED